MRLTVCIPCFNRRSRKRHSLQHQEPLITNESISSLAGIRSRMQEMGHFLNTTSSDLGPAINLKGSKVEVTAELISLESRRPSFVVHVPDQCISPLRTRRHTVDTPSSGIRRENIGHIHVCNYLQTIFMHCFKGKRLLLLCLT